MSSHKLDEVKQWCLGQRIQVLILTETRWHFSNEWLDPNWIHVHTGAADQAGAGILILISRRLCKPQDIRWAEVSVGRLAHVQLRFPQRCFDILAGYQHTSTSSRQRQADRTAWWNCLDRYLGTLPRRNVLLLAGDFNCRLTAAKGHVGCSEFVLNSAMRMGSPHPDEGLFLSIVRAHHLVALNTWSSKLGPSFHGCNGCSRIDFSFTRFSTADGCARDIQYLINAPFLECPHVGHFPLLGQLRKFWIPPQADQQTAGITMQQRDAGRRAYLDQSSTWQRFLHDSAPAIESHLTQADSHDPELIPELHHIASKVYQSCFPCQPCQMTQPMDGTGRSLILDKWRHREKCKLPVLPTPRNVLRSWFHLARFQLLKRSHKQHAYQTRQQAFETILAQAQTAADNHDSFQLFRVSNRFAPKMSKRRMQLRNVHGNIATPMEERAILHAFVAKTWTGPPTVPRCCPHVTGLPFGPEELLRALRTIPIARAVARPFTPGLIWRSHADLIMPHLYRILQKIWDCPQPEVPACWKDAWLLLIPKPMKPACTPDALRPLALQEPLGKAVIGLVAQIALKCSFAKLAPWPLWAYSPGRCTQHALLRVIAHCTAGRELVASQRPAVFSRHRQLPMYQICGALQIFIDLSKAFDSVCRQELFGRLDEVLDNPQVIQMLAQWHENTSYHVESNGGTEPIQVGAGVRQGCKAAPWLFNAFVLLYLSDLAHLIDWQWLQAHMNIYADDIHACGVFHDLPGLHRILFFFGLIMEVLQEKGLTINTAKSAAIITMGGTNFRAARKDLTTRINDGEWIKIKGRTCTFTLPVVKQTKYLGIVVGYAQFEDATVRCRVSLAKVAFARLKKWLTARRGFAARERLRLWTTCVFPILTYGIFTAGLTQHGLQLLQLTMTSMFRQIHHDHAFVTGRSHTQALQYHCIEPPLLWLWRAADSLFRSVTKPPVHPIPDDICNLLDWSPLQQVIAFILQTHSLGQLAPACTMSNEEALSAHELYCPFCQFQASSLSVLRRHLTCAHQVTMFRKHVPQPSHYMTHGLPQCVLCGLSFTTWRSFHIHVQRGCQVDQMDHRMDRPLAPFAEPAQPVTHQTPETVTLLSQTDLDSIMQREFGPRLLTLLHQRRWSELLHDRASCQFLSRNCLICGQYVGRAQAMHHHVRVAHHAYDALVLAKATQLTNLHSDESPCSACGVTFVSTHLCNVWFQIAALIVHGPRQTASFADAPAHLQCEICGFSCETAQMLHAHLQNEHKLVSSVWHESRDSFQGDPVCNHCHMMFRTMEGLRSHINQGRCTNFNPDLSTAPSDVLDVWKDATCRGAIEEVLSTAHNKLRLTLRCQCCPKRYTRSADLSAHLQGSHPEIWRMAQPVAFLLVQRYYGSLGCVCNPSCAVQRLQHVCLPFLQLAMQFVRLPMAVLMPAKQTTTELARFLPAHVPMDLRHNLERAFLQYDLTCLWTDALLMDSMSGNCYLCGLELLPAELAYHMHEAHHGLHPVVKSYVAQLLPHALSHSDNDCACFACGQILNTPTACTDANTVDSRQKLVQAHLRAQCPSVLQLAVLLSHIHYGATRLANGQRWGTPADAAILPEPGAAVGPQPEVAAKSRSSQAPKKKPCRHRSKRQRTAPRPPTGDQSRSAETPDPDGQAALADGSRSAGDPKGNDLHHLFQLQRRGGSAAFAPTGGGQMARLFPRWCLPTRTTGVFAMLLPTPCFGHFCC